MFESKPAGTAGVAENVAYEVEYEIFNNIPKLPPIDFFDESTFTLNNMWWSVIHTYLHLYYLLFALAS